MPHAATEQRSWEVWLSQADDYAKAMGGRTEKPSPFSASIQYNLIALALEGYVSYHGALPENHTFTDLLRAWEEVAPLEPELKASILKYEDMQSICSLEHYQRHDPTPEELRELRGAVVRLGVLVKTACVRESVVGGG